MLVFNVHTYGFVATDIYVDLSHDRKPSVLYKMASPVPICGQQTLLVEFPHRSDSRMFFRAVISEVDKCCSLHQAAFKSFMIAERSGW